MALIRKENATQMKVNQYKDMEYLTFPLLEESNVVHHLFSTRKGGVSKGIYSTMNLSYQRGDEPSAVDENFRRIAEVFDSTPDHIVCASQTHSTNIRIITEADCGKGVRKEKDYDEIDGLITNVPGIILCTSHADCVPIYLVDKRNKAIGLGHAGWRGTVGRISDKLLQEMNTHYGTEPEDVLAAIGPSICQDCYEVGDDVASEIHKCFPWRWRNLLAEGPIEGKYQLNLWEANRMTLLSAGIIEENITVTDICTYCNKDYLFSHRATNGKRGNMGAFLELRKS